MRIVARLILAWAAGVAVAFAVTGLAFGLREAMTSIGSSLPFSFIGFALTVAILYLPALTALDKYDGSVAPPLAAITCLLLSAAPIALINGVYGAGRGRAFTNETVFMFMLLGIPGAIFGWTWATNARAKA